MAENKINNKEDLPIHYVEETIFDDSVPSMKEKFIAEMKKIDEEMNKFSQDLTQLIAQSSTLFSKTTSANSFERQASLERYNWEALARSPLVERKGENKTLKLQFDVRQFDPNEITVKIQNDLLMVSAAHEEKSNDSSVLRQLHREFKFPKGLDPSRINSMLSKDGILTVQAPLPQMALTDKLSRCSTNSLSSK